MRDSIKQFIEICAETLPLIGDVYEFGSLQVPGQEDFADLRPFFPDKKYVGADMRSGPGVDVILNLHGINLPSESVGTVLCLDTLEHVEYPRKAIEEIYRILQQDGFIIISSVMNFAIHDCPNDYWRFTPEGFRSLLNIFNFSFVEFAGEDSFPHTVIGIGLKGAIQENAFIEFKLKLSKWKNTIDNSQRNNVQNKLKLFTPPILLQLWRKVKNSYSGI